MLYHGFLSQPVSKSDAMSQPVSKSDANVHQCVLISSEFISFMNEKVCSQIYALPKSVDIFIACLLMFGYILLGRAA